MLSTSKKPYHQKALLSVWLLIALLIFNSGHTQTLKLETKQELEDKGFEISTRIYDFPKNELPSALTTAYLGTRKADDGYVVCLLFSKNGLEFHRSNSIKLPDSDHYRCKRPNVSYEGGYLMSECQWMRGITFGEKYVLKKGQLNFEESYTYDLNETVYSEAKLAQKNDDPIAYCVAYSGAQFYAREMDYRAEESLKWTHKKALAHYRKKDYHSAAQMMLQLDRQCSMASCENLSKHIPAECKQIWSDATLFYLKAKKYKACIQLSERLIAVYHNPVNVYLQYGDALYATQNVTYREAYTTYSTLMIASNKKRLIPSRVRKRLND